MTGVQTCALPISSDDRVALRIRHYDEVEQILAALRVAGCRIEEMELLPTDLEDVFVRIMRDAA